MAKRKALADAQEMAAEILDDPEYRRVRLLRARTGTLPPAFETMLYHYRYGKPVETLDVTHHVEELAQLPIEELMERKRRLEEELGDVVH